MEPRSPIEHLQADKALHDKLLDHITTRLEDSYRAMSPFYERWRANERRYQAYIELKGDEARRARDNDDSKSPTPVSIIVPYTFAVVNTIVTFLMQSIAGRRPIFQISANNEDFVEAARRLEAVVQFHADHTKLVRVLHQFFLDGQIYGVGAVRCLWTTETRPRTRWVPTEDGTDMVPLREEVVSYEGNEVVPIDPYLFFPDPAVPMSEVARRGEYVFWRTVMNRLQLKEAEFQGQFTGVDDIPQIQRVMEEVSDRNIRVNSEGFRALKLADKRGLVVVDQGSILLIPKEFGLSDSERPERWLVTVANGKKIIQAEPLEMDHDMHPVVVAEPYTTGPAFGSMSIVDIIGPMQDILSWYVNSHIFNVRAALNNMFVVDPSAIEMQDLKDPRPGKILRLKKNAIGRDVRSAIYQLGVADVTGQHVTDMLALTRLIDQVSGVTDNLRGVVNSGRRSATEARISSEAAISRLAVTSRIVSAQALSDLARQMAINTQQFMSNEMFVRLLGEDGQEDFISVRPEQISGDFNFPVHDGTLPLDRVALLDVWRQILQFVAADPQLRERYDFGKIFEHVAELGGAKNIESFRLQVGEPGPQAVPIQPQRVGGLGPEAQQLLDAQAAIGVAR